MDDLRILRMPSTIIRQIIDQTYPGSTTCRFMTTSPHLHDCMSLSLRRFLTRSVGRRIGFCRAPQHFRRRWQVDLAEMVLLCRQMRRRAHGFYTPPQWLDMGCHVCKRISRFPSNAVCPLVHVPSASSYRSSRARSSRGLDGCRLLRACAHTCMMHGWTIVHYLSDLCCSSVPSVAALTDCDFNVAELPLMRQHTSIDHLSATILQVRSVLN
jgi:hypothetical protein